MVERALIHKCRCSRKQLRFRFWKCTLTISCQPLYFSEDQQMCKNLPIDQIITTIFCRSTTFRGLIWKERNKSFGFWVGGLNRIILMGLSHCVAFSFHFWATFIPILNTQCRQLYEERNIYKNKQRSCLLPRQGCIEKEFFALNLMCHNIRKMLPGFSGQYFIFSSVRNSLCHSALVVNAQHRNFLACLAH